MLARSLVSCFWAPLGAAHSHDNYLIASSALKSVLASESAEHNGADDGNVKTGGTVGRDGERGVALLSRVRDDNGDARPTSAVALATTRHTTRREREVSSGGRRRAGRCGRMEAERARVHAHAPCSSVREVGSGKKSAVCRPRCGFSRRLSPGDSKPVILAFPLLGPV